MKPEIVEGSAIAEAAQFLLDALVNGPVLVSQLKASAVMHGYSWRTIEDAKAKLKVRHEKEKVKNGRYYWMPPKQGRGRPKSLKHQLWWG